MNLSIRHWLAERYIEIHQIKELSVGQIAGVAFRIIQDMEVKSLIPLDICTVTEVLELPLGVVWPEITVIALLTENLLRSLSQKKPLKRNEGTWLAFQIAYLRALEQVLDQEASLQKPWIDRAMIWNKATNKQIAAFADGELHEVDIPKPPLTPKPLQDAQLHGLLKTLNPGKLTDTQAEQALSLVADSLLVQQMNSATVAWLVTNGTEEVEAKLLTQRLGHALPGYLLRVIAENAAPLAQLQKFVCLGSSLSCSITPEVGSLATASPTVDDKIDLYREQYRASLLQNLSIPLLTESFALKDIYIPLTGLPIEGSSSEQLKKISSPIDLRIWAQQQLDDLETVAVIESDAGYGKTSFCEFWAAKVARELYPTWMPIIIRLRDIKYGNTLESTLNSGFPFHSQTNLATWLKQNHPRCLLLLDGLDELPPSDQGKRSKVIFIEDLLRLQSQGRHKIVLTSRTETLQEIIPELLLLSKRIAIQPFDVEGLKQWFQQWAAVQSLPIAQNYFTFLKQAGLFANNSKLPELSAFVRQPLMLYLLGILHRDGLFDGELLQLAANSQNSTSATLLWEIHQRLSRWLLGYPLTGGIKTILLRSGSAHIHRSQAAIANLLSDRHPQDLLDQIQAIALKILHSDRHQVNLAGEFQPNTLPAFYFRTSESTLNTEFTHPKLGEYLCAEAIATQLKTLTQRQESANGTVNFILESPSSVAQHLYNLLGYGILRQEIAALAIAGLQYLQKWEFSFAVLSQRLESFWHAYCQGRWLDEGIAHKALTHFHTLQNPINVEQVNAAVGLNVFLLLSACYRQQKAPFCPCGNPANSAQFHPQALHMLIARTAVLSKNAFAGRISSQFLAGINLSGAYLLQVTLAGANLEQTNLSDAVLCGANLAGANLTGANLAGANLTNANLAGANLTNANLTVANLAGANLTGANLAGTNLTHACVFATTFSDTDKEIATFNGAIVSLEQFQSLKQLLSQHSLRNITKAIANTDAWVKNLPDLVLIESVEGEPILPVDLHHDLAEDETILSLIPHEHS
ncbi:pentapeptide repeat-containing protein [Calothrix sp. PCC 7507]|uniref:pentapeptide repeat-containing protein n=1 Tax=Calothrix sp. PCC 7507 TaxID=99598 RepID=UPI00029EE377|nr:pentapeptide repeat-containing protein [Calothrix sp. PCC 7507]AFY32261.1 pentapeptide repeat protein [Calothrix sp. PCC 7507]